MALIRLSPPIKYLLIDAKIGDQKLFVNILDIYTAYTSSPNGVRWSLDFFKTILVKTETGRNYQQTKSLRAFLQRAIENRCDNLNVTREDQDKFIKTLRELLPVQWSANYAALLLKEPYTCLMRSEEVLWNLTPMGLELSLKRLRSHLSSASRHRTQFLVHRIDLSMMKKILAGEYKKVENHSIELRCLADGEAPIWQSSPLVLCRPFRSVPWMEELFELTDKYAIRAHLVSRPTLAEFKSLLRTATVIQLGTA